MDRPGGGAANLGGVARLSSWGAASSVPTDPNQKPTDLDRSLQRLRRASVYDLVFEFVMAVFR